MGEKIHLRSQGLKARSALSKEAKSEKSHKITQRLEALEIFQKAKHVLFYYSTPEEVSTHALLQKYLSKKALYLPVIQGKNQLKSVLIKSPLSLQKNKEGIQEPSPDCIEKEVEGKPELILVPGVAFDKKGHRIGMGKGYYDRFLTAFPKAVLVGLAFQEQMVDPFEKDPYDVDVHLIITDQTLYHVRPY